MAFLLSFGQERGTTNGPERHKLPPQESPPLLRSTWQIPIVAHEGSRTHVDIRSIHVSLLDLHSKLVAG